MRGVRTIEMRRTCCGVPVWMLDTTCWSNSRLSGAEKMRSASMLLASDPAHSRWRIHERVRQRINSTASDAGAGLTVLWWAGSWCTVLSPT